MGVFDFMKSVGKKLGFGDEEEAPTAEELKSELDSYKLGTDKVEVKVVGDKAILKGVVSDQSIFEKAVIAVGNTLGISKVEAEELKMAFVLVEAVVDDLGTAVPHDVVALAALGEVHLEAGVAVFGEVTERVGEGALRETRREREHEHRERREKTNHCNLAHCHTPGPSF